MSKSKTGHPKNCMQNCKLRYWQKAHYQENMVDIPVPQNGLQMAIKKKKKTPQDSNKIFTSFKGVECTFKNNRKTPLPRATLAK